LKIFRKFYGAIYTNKYRRFEIMMNKENDAKRNRTFLFGMKNGIKNVQVMNAIKPGVIKE